MNNLISEGWLPMPIQMGPPLPRSMGVYWPWYKPEVPPEAPIYACPYCPAEFSTEQELYDHIRTAHPAQPPVIIYMCPYCGARFDTMSELTDHITRVHPPAKVYTCPHCGAQFSTEAELNYHIEIAHPEVPPAPPEEADIKDFDFKLTRGTYDVGAKVAFTAPYDYKGIAQNGQLTISIGTGVYPSFFTKHTYAPILVRFEAAADWETRGLNGNITLPNVLEPGQTYSVRARLETLTVKTQETDTDWAAFDIEAVAKPKFYMPAEMTVKVTDGKILSMYWKCEFSCPITNKGNDPGTQTITIWNNYEGTVGTRSITLKPGETYVWKHWRYIDFKRADPCTYRVTGDWEGDNVCEGTAKAVIGPPVPPAVPSGFYLPSRLDLRAEGPYDEKYYTLTFSTRITNRGDVTETHQLIWGSNFITGEYEEDASRIITLAPGESHDWSWEYTDIPYWQRGYFTCWLFGDWGAESVGVW